MRLLAALALAISLSGCALFQPYTEPVSKVDPKVCLGLPDAAKAVCKEAGDTILKGYVSIASADGKIAKNKKAGIYTAQQAQGYLDKMIDGRKKLDNVRDIFNSGNYADALSQANIVDTLLATLTEELAKQVAKEQK